MLSKFGALRAAVKGGTWAERVMVPLDAKIFKKNNGKFIQGTVVQVNDVKKTVELADGTIIPYDILVAATGSRNFSPAEPPTQVTSTEGTLSYWTQTRLALNGSKSIAVIGSGAVALEFAAEIKSYANKKTKVTLIAGSRPLLHSSKPALPDSFKQEIKQLLHEFQIEIVEQDVIIEKLNFNTDSPIVFPKNGRVQLDNGTFIDADTMIFAIGSVLQTSIYPTSWIDKTTNELKIDQHWRVNGQNHIFAVGDIAQTGFTKLGFWASTDGNSIGKNIISILQGKEPKASIYRPVNIMSIPFGPKHGRSYILGMTWGNWVTSKLKGQDLMSDKVWNGILGVNAVKVPEEEKE
jgi:NADH dehydrogenase FAD-containing subunit